MLVTNRIKYLKDNNYKRNRIKLLSTMFYLHFLKNQYINK
jgi:hypothetical protein